MGILFQCMLQLTNSAQACARTSIGEEGGSVTRKGGDAGGVTVQKLRGLLVAAAGDITCGEHIAIPLVVIGVQPQKLAVMLNRVVQPSRFSQAIRKTGSRSHVRTRFKNSPKVPRISGKRFLAQSAISGANALFIKLHCFMLVSSCFLCQENESISTISGNRQCFPCEFDPPPSI